MSELTQGIRTDPALLRQGKGEEEGDSCRPELVALPVNDTPVQMHIAQLAS